MWLAEGFPDMTEALGSIHPLHHINDMSNTLAISGQEMETGVPEVQGQP